MYLIKQTDRIIWNLHEVKQGLFKPSILQTFNGDHNLVQTLNVWS